MFGHQDDQHDQGAPAVNDVDDNTNVAPDGLLEAIASQDAPPTDLPAVHDDNAGASSYIATESTGQPTDNPVSSSSDDLLNIKQQALQQLSPLVGHLDQTPEEKFHTTMMMIQAADNQDLVKDAYAAAQAITDEKTRAQALLDIINEINYFTQHHAE